MAALVAVDAHRHGDKAPAQPHALSAYLLRRERAHWHTLHARTVYVATLTGAMRRDEAHHVLHRVQLTEPGIDTILDDHRFCYPPHDSRTVLESLHPDRLGEDMLALTTPGHEHTGDNGWQPDDWATNTAHTLLSGAEPDPPAWAPGAVTVLIETARRWQHVAVDVLYPMLRQRPDLAIAAGGAALPRLADLPTADIEVLEAIEARLPDDRHVDLDLAATAITTTLTRHRLADLADPADRARLHATHAWRLANAGHHQQALAPSQDAAELYRQLAQANPAAYLPNLATSLWGYAWVCVNIDRDLSGALAAAQEAISLYTRLAERSPAVFAGHLVVACRTPRRRPGRSWSHRRGNAVAPVPAVVDHPRGSGRGRAGQHHLPA
jgi:hypothetical protein